MIHKNRILQLVIGFFISGLFLSCSGGEAENNPIEKNEKGEILAPEERTWKNNLIGEEISLHSDITDSLYNAQEVKRNKDQILVSDVGDMRLKRFDLYGKYIDSFGSEGKGPGEFQQLLDYGFQGSDTLFALDDRKMRLMVFNARTTDFITEYETEPTPYRLAVLEEQLVIESSVADKLFYLLDFQGNTGTHFGEMMENKQQNSGSVAGDIYPVDTDTGFVFAPHYASYLYYYNSDGNNTKTIRTPDRIPFQETVHENRGGTRIIRPSESEFQTSDLKITGGNIYEVLQNNGEKNELPNIFVDVYDLETGGYLHSVKLPSLASDILVTDNRIYLINSELAQVQAYQYSKS